MGIDVVTACLVSHAEVPLITVGTVVPEVELASAGCQPVVGCCVCFHTGVFYKSQLVKHVAA